MRIKPSTELLVGVVVTAAVVAAAASIFEQDPGGVGETYRITAKYPQVDGITIGSPVMAAGLPMGRVVDMQLDENYFAVLTLEVDRRVELDSDASAQIVSGSIFGSKYVRLDIGGGEFTIEDGGQVFYTEQAMILQDLLSQVIAIGRARSAAGDDDATDDTAGNTDAPAIPGLLSPLDGAEAPTPGAAPGSPDGASSTP